MGSQTEESVPRVAVRVVTQYLAQESKPRDLRFVFAYTITIANHGLEPCQLLSRHWVITDGTGNQEVVDGEGVVGKQPRLNSGEAFRYTSAAILKTSFGTMEGRYQFKKDDGELFDVPIETFMLTVPSETLN